MFDDNLNCALPEVHNILTKERIQDFNSLYIMLAVLEEAEVSRLRRCTTAIPVKITIE